MGGDGDSEHPQDGAPSQRRPSPVSISSVRAEEPGSRLESSPHRPQDHTGGERSRGPDVRHRAGGEGRGGLAVSSPHWRLLIQGQKSQCPTHPAPTPDASSAANPDPALLSLNLPIQIPSGPLHLGPLEGMIILSFLFCQNVVIGIDTNFYNLMGRLSF